MRIECSACHAKYVVADSKVPPGGARVRCRKCQGIFVIQPGAVEPAPTALETIPGPPPPAEPLPAAPAEPPPAEPLPAAVAEPSFVAPAEPPSAAPVEAPSVRPAPAPAEPAGHPRMELERVPSFLSEPEGPGAHSMHETAEPLHTTSAMQELTQATAPARPEPVVAMAPEPPPPPTAPAPAPGGYVSTPVSRDLPEAERLRHEKARRLARVLASDIAIYNKEKRDRGVREGNLVAVLGYEIKKSWEIYKERVTPELANATPYFRDALNELLAEGKKVF